MTTSSPLPFQIIIDPDNLNTAVQRMQGAKAIALDTESNSMHYYPEQLCLIQLADREKVCILDTITLKDITPLGKILEDNNILKVIHGADYDIRSLHRHSGLRVRSIYDTYLAARFAGLTEVGLAALIKNLLGITIEKSKKLQTADWGRRPLSREAWDYAATDVFHLLTLQEILDKKLRELGRTAWAAEEFLRLEDIRYQAPNPEIACFSVKGAEILDDRGYAVLRSLCSFREEEARRQHRPPFFIIPDVALVDLAANPTASLGSMRFEAGLRKAISAGLAAPPLPPPPRVYLERMTAAQLALLAHLKLWRTTTAAKLALDPALVWPMVSLQRLARDPGSFDSEINEPNIRRWQRTEFTAALQRVLGEKS